MSEPDAAQAATYIVTNTNDSGAGSLRQAILDANTSPDADMIIFDIVGDGPHIIAPLTELPRITDSVIIDGTTQPGASCASWIIPIELSGVNLGSSGNGLRIWQGIGSTIRGLAIVDFPGSALVLSGGSNHVVECNLIGTDSVGSVTRGNDTGIVVWTYETTIRNNVIAGIENVALELASNMGQYANNVTVTGNTIGLSADRQQPIPNRIGIQITDAASHNVIGGTTPETRNFIYNSELYGIWLDGNRLNPSDDVQDITILGNAVVSNGVGIYISHSGNNTIGGMAGLTPGGACTGACNLISGNTFGIRMVSDVGVPGNTIRGNRIEANTALGIDLGFDGVTSNDPGDGDTGPNTLQNYPVLTDATTRQIRGTLNSTPNTSFTLEVFTSLTCHPSGYGEGETHQFAATVMTDAIGIVSFRFVFASPVAVGHYVTATATAPDGSTSEFSACRLVIETNEPPENLLPEPQSIDEDTPLTLSGSSAISISDLDAGTNPVQLTLSAAHGILTLSGTTDLAFGAGDGTGDISMAFTGSIPAINTALDGLVFMPDADYSGSASLTITTNDQGFTGPDGAKTATDILSITINPINDPPLITVPDMQAAYRDAPLIFRSSTGNRIRIDDADAASDPVAVTLAVTTGSLTVNGTSGVILEETDTSIRMTGTLTQINARLDGMIYQPGVGYAGPDTLMITADDLGHNGAGGPLLGGGSVVITVHPTVAPPSLIAPTNAAPTSNNLPTFAWGAVPHAEIYHFQVGNAAAFDDFSIIITTTTSYTAPALLEENQTYFWRVCAVDGDGVAGPWSAVWSFTVDSQRPAAPILSTPKDHTLTRNIKPTFLWNSVLGAANYELQIAKDYTFEDTLPVIPTVSRSFTLGSALDYGVYYWRVRAQGAAGRWGDWSHINTLTLTILYLPTNAKHLTDSTPTLQVVSAGTGAQYHIQVDEIGGDYSEPAYQKITTALSATTSKLVSGDYQWRARSNRGTGWSGWTPGWTFTITPPPTVAPRLSGPANYAKLDTPTPDFSWQAVAGGYSYQLQIATAETFARPVQDIIVPASSSMVFQASPLPDGGRYFWRVRAINETGVAGAWSAKWQFTIRRMPAPILLGPANSTAIRDTTPDFSWNGIDGLTHYEIQVDTSSSFNQQYPPLRVDSTGYTAGDLPDGRYFWRVRAISETGVPGFWSAPWSLIIDTTGPVQPTLLTPVNGAGTRNTTPTFTWNITPTAKTYHFQIAKDANLDDVLFEKTIAGATSTTLPGDVLREHGVYYWHVLAHDALGNAGEWSATFRLDVTIMLTPKDGAMTTIARPTFSWAALPGAETYQFQLDNDSSFPGPAVDVGAARNYTPLVALPPGAYYWRVRVSSGDMLGDWMPTWMLVIAPGKPGQPLLSAPPNQTSTNDVTPVFQWQGAANAARYRIQIDNNINFSSPEQNELTDTPTYLADALVEGTYYWRVRAINSMDAAGAWSTPRQIGIDITPPPVPVMIAPIDGASSTNPRLKLSWGVAAGAKFYDVQVDSDEMFLLPPINNSGLTTYTPPMPLSRGIYYWRVRAIDAAGNMSDWSEPRRSFVIIAGVTAPLLPTLTPTPTELPAQPPPEPPLEPTTEPTVEPTIAAPTAETTPDSTVEPTAEPTVEPTTVPSMEPISTPTLEPTNMPPPTSEPTAVSAVRGLVCTPNSGLDRPIFRGTLRQGHFHMDTVAYISQNGPPRDCWLNGHSALDAGSIRNV